MRSFTLSALASLAFGIFCSAAPTPSGLPAIGLPSVPAVARDSPAPAEAGPTLQSVFATASASLGPLADKAGEGFPFPHPSDSCTDTEFA